jgi:hypothetical protein
MTNIADSVNSLFLDFRNESWYRRNCAKILVTGLSRILLLAILDKNMMGRKTPRHSIAATKEDEMSKTKGKKKNKKRNIINHGCTRIYTDFEKKKRKEERFWDHELHKLNE